MALRDIEKKDLEAWIDSFTSSLQVKKKKKQGKLDQTIEKKDYKLEKSNLSDETDEINETRSCLIRLESLQEFMAYIDEINNNKPENKIDGIRIYFTRKKIYKDHLMIKKNGKEIPQMNIVIVPTCNYSFSATDSRASAEDFFKDKKIKSMSPGQDHTEHSGLCPPNCRK